MLGTPSTARLNLRFLLFSYIETKGLAENVVKCNISLFVDDLPIYVAINNKTEVGMFYTNSYFLEQLCFRAM